MRTKREVTVEAEIRNDRVLLSRVAEELRVALLLPECLVWSAIPDSNEARIWMVIAISEPDLSDLVNRLRKLPGVRTVVPLGPDTAIMKSLAKATQ